MGEQETGRLIPSDDPVAVELRLAVRAGDVQAIQRSLHNDPALATARLGGRGGGTETPLHLVAGWPGYFPNGPQIVRLLIGAGADPNAPTSPDPPETPLHYAASNDDVDVAEALIEEERISRCRMARSALRSITPLVMAAGTSPACW